MSANTSFDRPDGAQCPAYDTAAASGRDAPGIVVLQEWWGLNDQIQRTADRLAAAGYRALVPDLYRGDVALDTAEAEHRMEGLDFADAATQDIRGAVRHLRTDCPAVGVIGFCMGGVLSALAAMHVSELDAAVDWYGVPPAEAGDPAAIGIPLQGHFALRDSIFPPAAVNDFEQRLQNAGVVHEFFRYDAEHAFGNEDWDHYDPEAADMAWSRSLDFFGRHLRNA